MTGERNQGHIRNWKWDRAFGFIRPDQDEPDIFVHLSELPDGEQPASLIGRRVSYLVDYNPALNRRRAARIQFVDDMPRAAAQ